MPPPVRDMALKAADSRGMTVGDWVAEAIVAYARGERKRERDQLPATDTPPDLIKLIERLDDRLSRLEADRRPGLFARFFGRRS